MPKKVPLTEYIRIYRNPDIKKRHPGANLRLLKPRLHSKRCMNPKGIQHRDSTKVRRLCYLDCPSLEYDKDWGYYCIENYMEDIDG